MTTFHYDSLGNLLSEEINTGGAVDTVVHSSGVSQFGPHTASGPYTFDSRGRLLNPNGHTTKYTDFDLPRQIGETHFRYDAEGTRVSKVGPTGTVLTFGGLYERRIDAQGATDVYMVPGPEGVVAQIALDPSMPNGGKVTYVHGGRKGSVNVASTAAGVVQARLYYDPFGARIDSDGDAAAGLPGDLKIGFNGLDHDDELGLINQRGRIYNPTHRRFLTPDPIVSSPLNGQTWNPYSYVRNDPVNRTDPSGYCDSSPCGVMATDVGVATLAALAAAAGAGLSIDPNFEELEIPVPTPTTTRQAAPAPPASISINDHTATPIGATSAPAPSNSTVALRVPGRYIEPEGLDWFIRHGDRIAAITGVASLVPLAIVSVGAPLAGKAAVAFGSSGLNYLTGLTMTLIGGREVVFGVSEGDEGRAVEGAFVAVTGWGMVGEGLGSGPRASAAGGGGKFGSGKPPHTAEVTVVRDGKVVSQQTLTSGGMTPDEAALGFPRSSLATHTEARAVRSTPLQAGDSMTIQGQYPPCPSCKGAMNKAASESGASIQYTWEGRTWTAGGGKM